MAESSADPVPVEIRYARDQTRLYVTFADGRTFDYSAEFLRVHSPSAEVKGHGPGQEKLVFGRRHVGIMRIEPVGNYAVRLIFDDLHDTGIYSWPYLYDLGERQDVLWTAYTERLAKEGLSREPPAST